MKVERDEYDTFMAENPKDSLGFCLTMKTGNVNGDGSEISQCFIVDSDPITEMGRMNGYGISLLHASGAITPEQASQFKLEWRKIIKS